MKKLFLMGISTLGVMVVAFLFLNACKKDQAIQPEEQVNQLEFAKGCELAPGDVYAKFSKMPDAKENTAKASSYFLSCPTVGNQGSEWSCTSWGTTYAAKSIVRGLSPIFSQEFVYNSLTTCSGTCTCGLYVSDALNLLKSKGACTYSAMPSVSGCGVKPNSTQLTNAASYKTTTWYTLTITTANIKNYLSYGYPVIIAGPTNTAFNNLKSNAVLGAFTGSNLGNHCTCIIGYDDSKGAFKFINSWGTGWGTNGFGWISYSYLTSWVKEAYTLSN